MNRHEFVFLFDVENGNPNGDPDAGNMPRIDPETSHGLITDVCLKRKVRNYAQIAKEGCEGYNIYVQEKAVLNKQNELAYINNPEIKSVSKKMPTKIEEARKITQWMCNNFFDVRTFGAVMTTEVNCGQVRGPVQINFAKSIDPISQLDITITRMAVTTEAEAKAQSGDNRTMGRKHIVPYGLYRVEGYISGSLAEQTGFSDADLNLLWEALINMFDHDHSAARGKMCSRKLYVFEHSSKLGNAPAHKLFEKITVTRNNQELPPRAFTDYLVSAPSDGEVETGVKIICKL